MHAQEDCAELRRRCEEAEQRIEMMMRAIDEAICMLGNFERHMEIRAVLLVALSGCAG